MHHSEAECGAGEPEEPDAGPGEEPAGINAAVEVDLIWDDCLRERSGFEELAEVFSCDRVEQAVCQAASVLGFGKGRVGVLITDDPSIHELNARHLQHDYPTDVISFPYSEDDSWIEGELVASIDTAAANAAEAGWAAEDELLLYVIHGTLHIGGMDDHESSDRAAMRRAERAVLIRLGMNPEPAKQREANGGGHD